MLPGGRPLPPEILAPSDLPSPDSASFDTFCLVAPQPQVIEKEVQLRLTRTRHGNKTPIEFRSLDGFSHVMTQTMRNYVRVPFGGQKKIAFNSFWSAKH